MKVQLRAVLRDIAIVLPALAVALGACDIGGRSDVFAPNSNAQARAIGIPCTASVVLRTVECGAIGTLEFVSADFIGGKLTEADTNITLTSSNVSYNAGTEIFQFDVTIKNRTVDVIGTPDGTTPDPNGIKVFFYNGPTVTVGSGTVSVANADGTETFTTPGQPYFRYNEVLDPDEVSSAKTWQLNVPTTATNFTFKVLLWTDLPYRLVINEVLANPGGTISDANGEWLEIYNRGHRPVNLQGLVIADSAASGRRPYHLISSSLVVVPGGYVVLGNTTNTTNNGGVPVDYAYGAAMALANSLDAIKISRVSGTDTLTIDRTQYASAAISAQNGISRELTNQSLDNANMDGSNWADALVTAVYGPGGRGTPKAQNSQFVPSVIETPVVMNRRATLPTFGVTRRQTAGR